jgi:hypothetical protein
MDQLRNHRKEQQLRNRSLVLELVLARSKVLELVLVRSRLVLFRSKKPCVHGS